MVWGGGGAAYPMEKMTRGVLKTKPRALPSLPGVLEAVGSQPEWTSLRKRSSVLTACPPLQTRTRLLFPLISPEKLLMTNPWSAAPDGET